MMLYDMIRYNIISYNMKIEIIQNWFEKKDLVMIQQRKCTEFYCGSFWYVFDFERSVFLSKLPEKSFLSPLHRKAAAAAAAAASAAI